MCTGPLTSGNQHSFTSTWGSDVLNRYLRGLQFWNTSENKHWFTQWPLFNSFSTGSGWTIPPFLEIFKKGITLNLCNAPVVLKACKAAMNTQHLLNRDCKITSHKEQKVTRKIRTFATPVIQPNLRYRSLESTPSFHHALGVRCHSQDCCSF